MGMPYYSAPCDLVHVVDLWPENTRSSICGDSFVLISSHVVNIELSAIEWMESECLQQWLDLPKIQEAVELGMQGTKLSHSLLLYKYTCQHSLFGFNN